MLLNIQIAMHSFWWLPSLLFALPGFAQAPAEDTLPSRAAQQLRNHESGWWQARQDSLARIFNQPPPYVLINYSKNLRQPIWSPSIKLRLLMDKRQLTIQPDSSNQFLLPPSGDSLALTLTYRGKTIRFEPIPVWYCAHGAEVTFGYISRARLRRQLHGKQEEYFRALFRDADPKQWSRTKNVRGIIYQKIVPRVYGDGMAYLAYRALLH